MPKRARPWVVAVGALYALTLLALPLSARLLGTWWAPLSLLAAGALDIARSRLRIRLRSWLRAANVRDSALEALRKRSFIPEADLESAFWSAHLRERAVSVDIPALLGASVAALGLLCWAWAGLAALSTLIVPGALALALAAWGARRRVGLVETVVARRRTTASWLAAAERDCGEVAGEAEAQFLKLLHRHTSRWSEAEDRLDRAIVLARLLVGFAACAAVALILVGRGISPLSMLSNDWFAPGALSNTLLVGAGLPIFYALYVHTESLIVIRTTLRQINVPFARKSKRDQSLPTRPRALTATGLTFGYGTDPIFFELSLRLPLERITVLTGPNGVGKSTLAALISGTLEPVKGRIELDGFQCAAIDPEQTALVPQSPLLMEGLTVEENVRLIAPQAAQEDISSTLEQLGFEFPLDTQAGRLSRGEQRRIAIARALLKRPRVLVLDEPEVWLDTEGRKRLAQALGRRLPECAILVIAHRTDWLGDHQLVELSGKGAELFIDVSVPLGTSSACG
jgi:ABC-type multidrug transport system fused ATPase/permease subunit